VKLGQDETGDRPVRVVIYTAELLGDKLAGPGIRAFRFAEALSRVAEVRLLSEQGATIESDKFEISRAGGARLVEHARWADVLIMQGPLLTYLPEVLDTATIVIADLYDPFLLEQLQQGLYKNDDNQCETAEFTVRIVNDMLRFSDYFICASEKQRDMWIGQLTALGRINPHTYRDDPTLRSLIDIVPFGVDEEPPVQSRHGIRGTVEGISESDKVVLWGGGIYDWFDPQTLVRAIAQLSVTHDDVRLFFLAKQNANPGVESMQIVDDTVQLARTLGVLDSSVFFNEHWVDHADRANYFLDADVGVSAHLDHLETAYSFRTRLLDYIWAGLPIVNSAGDAFERVIVERGLGKVVTPGDVDALAEALEKVLYDDAASEAVRRNVRAYAPELVWSNAVKPLVDFIESPRRAADHDQVSAAHEADMLARQRAQEASAVPDADSGDERRELEERIRTIESSASWRVTAPLRKVMSTIRRR
jgi:glycosyltransferase involved in cell wall biosynthesis